MSIEKQRIKQVIQRFLTPDTRYVRKNINGHDMVLDTQDIWMRDNLLWCDIYEPETSKYITENIKKNDVVLDIGAHIGYHTLNFARAGAVVHAFEPDPINYKLLSVNTKEYSDYCSVYCYDRAVSDEIGTTTLYLSPYHSAWNSLIKKLETVPLVVQSLTVDSLSLPRIDWIKIDVEGAEESVLQGMIETLRYLSPRVIVEWLPKNGADLDAISELFVGWEWRRLDHNIVFWRRNLNERLTCNSCGSTDIRHMKSTLTPNELGRVQYTKYWCVQCGTMSGRVDSRPVRSEEP